MSAHAAAHTSHEARVEWHAVASHERQATLAKRQQWTGRIMSSIAVLFLLFDGIIHVMVAAPAIEASQSLGISLAVTRALGIVELACLALYLMPRTAVLGAILWTGYLGGAIATQVRVGAPLWSTTLFPVYVAVLLWGGLWLRDAQLREVVPFRR